jgi:hypothetical protein
MIDGCDSNGNTLGDDSMIHLLASIDYPKVRPLFQGVYLSLVIDGVLAGNSVGQAWADDPAQPRTALMWDKGYIIYVVGDAGNIDINQQLGEFFTTQLAPAARATGIDGFKFVYGNPAWERQMATVFPALRLNHYPRVVYTVGERPSADWRSRLPPGYAMRWIDQGMLSDSALGNLPDLIKEKVGLHKVQDHWVFVGPLG